MKSILFISYTYLNGNGGGVYASQALINALAEICDSITVICPQKEGKTAENISQKVKFVYADYDISKFQKILLRIIGRIHFMTSVFKKEIKLQKYDTVIFNSSLCSSGLINTARKYNCKIITIHHNFEQEYIRDNSAGIERMIHLKQSIKAEKESVLKSDLNLTLTCDDKELLYKYYDNSRQSSIEVVGCFENKGRTHPKIKDERTRQNRFVITGNLSAVQTHESLVPWIKYYFPILKRICHNPKLTIAGKNPSNIIKKICEENDIEIIENPVTMIPVLEKADFYICPTSLGGGLKLRIMDGLGAGLPVLTHTISGRGYEVFQDSCLFTYKDISSFESALIKMLSCSINSQQIQEEYLRTFSFESGKRRIERILMKYSI